MADYNSTEFDDLERDYIRLAKECDRMLTDLPNEDDDDSDADKLACFGKIEEELLPCLRRMIVILTNILDRVELEGGRAHLDQLEESEHQYAKLLDAEDEDQPTISRLTNEWTEHLGTLPDAPAQQT